MKASIAFNLAANGVGNFFTLDSATKGVLDGATYTLAGDVLVDVTNDLRAVKIRRGRSRTLDKFTAGNANLTLDNRDRYYDPTYASSPYYGSILPRKQVVIEHLGYTLFTGQVEDWDFGYTLSGDAVAETSCVDPLSYLATQILTPGTATSQATGTRVGTILDQAGWSSSTRNISAGAATLNADYIPANTNALAYLQKIELSEPGAFFMSREGNATFRSRTDLQTFTSGVTFGTGGVPFIDIGIVYGTEEMTNSVNVIYPNGTAVGGTATADNLTSQAAYGIIDETYTTLLNSAADAQFLADWLVGIYGEPQYRVDSLSVNLNGLSTSQQAQVLSLELTDTVLVTWTPNSIGSAISQYVSIDGIEHDANTAQHIVTFTMSETSVTFLLDSATFGVLDSNALGF
ncbi:MAG: hypothetical protein RL134_373 [Actinomycetota bacterium]